MEQIVKQIIFEHSGKVYTLEYTRDSIRQMEREGFSVQELKDKPLTSLPKLFAGAFKSKHRFDVKQKQIEEIFELFTNKQALIDKLIDMYNDPLESLFDEPVDEKNAIAWEPNF